MSELPATGDGRRAAEEDEAATPNTITRRRALQVLGAVPVAAALVQAPVQQPKPLTPGVTSQVPSGPAATGGGTAAPTFFNKHERRTLRVLVDYIIPRDEHSGSATDAKVPEYIEFLLAEKDANPATQVAFQGGLSWIDIESQKRYGKAFVDATDAQRREILDDIAYPAKAKPGMGHGVAFFNRLRDMTASGFFSSAIGFQDLQYKGNVFNPGYDGCPPAALKKLGVSYDVMQTRISPQER